MDVTLIAVDCTDRIRNTLSVLKKASQQINFKEIVILTNRKPKLTKELPNFYIYKHIKKIENINEYNKFMFLELYKYFDTSHCLTIQYDCGILYPERWQDNWLEFDYIGAPWLYKTNSYVANTGEHVRVGNGGFSLRSKRLCELPTKMGWELRQEQGFYNEDGNICCYWRKEILGQGIKYAPIEVASEFSYENLMQENYGVKPFGYHKNKPPITWR